jgi:Rrf2 family iron-sulfur cluster assembly transcriptional regulator
LVESTRGPGGGYSLSRNAEKITMADIVGAVDAPTEEEAGAEGGWMNSELWASLNEKMLTHLQSITLRQLVAEQRTKGVTVEPAPQPTVKRGVFAKPKSALKITAPNSVFALAGSLMPSRG